MGFCKPCGRMIPDYQWSSHVEGRKHQAAVAAQQNAGPPCHCDVASVRRTSHKENENKGRDFYVCRSGKCSFFQWVDGPSLSSELSGTSCTMKIRIQESHQQSLSDAESEANGASNARIDLSWLSIQITVVDEHTLEIKTPYDAQFLSLFKARIKGRQWQPAKKVWSFPKSSLPQLVALLSEVSIPVPREIQKLSSVIDPDLTEIVLQAAGSSVSVSFPYDVTIVSILKQLHPLQRQFDSLAKKWAIDVEAVDELIAMFEAAKRDCEAVKEFVPPSLTLLEALKHDVNHAKEKEQKFKVDSTASWEETTDPSVGAQDKPAVSSIMQRKAFQAVFLHHRDKRVKVEAEQHERCICGDPEDRTGGQHVCRLFAKFNCSYCGNTWTTAYCWYNPVTNSCETQACRSCGTENKPADKRARNKSGMFGNKIHGAHDSARCGMCRKLGYNCSMRFHPY